MAKDRLSWWKTAAVLAALAVIVLGGLYLVGRTEWATWRDATRKDTVEAYRGYLERFPEGENAGRARNRIDALVGPDEATPL